MKKVGKRVDRNITKESKISLHKIVFDDRLFSLASTLAATYEMQDAGYFYFDTGDEHKILVNIIFDEEVLEDSIKSIEKEFKNQVVRFLRYEINLAKRIKERLVNYYQSYFSFEYKDYPKMIFEQTFADLAGGRQISEESDDSNINNKVGDNGCGISKEKKTAKKESGEGPEKSIIKEEDFSEIKSTDKLEDVVVNDEEGISTPWEIKYGSTENE